MVTHSSASRPVQCLCYGRADEVHYCYPPNAKRYSILKIASKLVATHFHFCVSRPAHARPIASAVSDKRFILIVCVVLSSSYRVDLFGGISTTEGPALTCRRIHAGMKVSNLEPSHRLCCAACTALRLMPHSPCNATSTMHSTDIDDRMQRQQLHASSGLRELTTY